MKLRLVAPSRGARWVRDGFAVFVRFPLAFAGVFAMCLVAMATLSLLPFIGVVLLLVLLPAGSLAFMIATRLAVRGTVPIPGVFIELLRSERSRRIGLVKVGLAYAAATLVVMWLSDALDGGRLDALIVALPTGNKTPEVFAAKLADPRLQFGLLLRLLLAAGLSVPFWHAPALIYWGGLGWAKSLFFSTMACWRNKGAFVVYGLVWAAVTIGVMIAVGFSLALFGQAGPALAAMPVTLVLTTVFYVTLFFTFADCFEMAPDDRLPAAA